MISATRPELKMEDDFLGDILDNAPDFSPSSKSHTTDAPSDRQYFRRIGMEVVGPYDLSELQDLLEQGRLHETDRIRRSDSLNWLPCQEFAELEFDSAVEHDSELQEASSLLDEMLSDAEDAPYSPVVSASAAKQPDFSDVESADAESAEPVGSPDLDLDAPQFDLSGLDSEDVDLSDLDAADIDLSDLDSPELDLSDLDSRDLDIPDLDIPELDVSASGTSEAEPAAETKVDVSPKMPSPLPPKPEPAPSARPDPNPSRKPVPIPMWSEEDEAEISSQAAKRKPGGLQFEMPSQALLFVLAGLAVIYGVVALWPKANPAAGRVSVKGTVSVDGTPLANGSISFAPAPQTEGPSSRGKVEQGSFAIDAPLGPGVGEYRVVVVVGDLFGGPQAMTPPRRGGSATQVAGQRFEQNVTTKLDGDNSFSLNFSSKDGAGPSEK